VVLFIGNKGCRVEGDVTLGSNCKAPNIAFHHPGESYRGSATVKCALNFICSIQSGAYVDSLVWIKHVKSVLMVYRTVLDTIGEITMQKSFLEHLVCLERSIRNIP
jgi:hypothetical protein